VTVGQFFAILRARWWVVLLVLGVVVAGTLGVSLSLTKKYTATASVVVDPKPDPVSAVLYSGGASPAFMATQVDIIQSDRVAQRVVRNLKLTEDPAIQAQWREATQGEGSIEVWLAELFKGNMDVKPSRESNVITVSYNSPNPKFAAALANAFVQAYVDTTLDLRVNPAKQFTSFFDTRAKEARDALEQAQAKLSAFQRERGITATDERLDIETSRMNELSSQLVVLQAISAESSSRQTAAGTAGDRMPEVLSNPVIGALKADISRLEARLQELGSKLGDNHPQVVELRANIAELRTRMQEETRRVTGGVGVSNSINRQREGQIRSELESQRARVMKLKQVRDEAAVLARDVDSAQRNYDAVLARLNQTSLESQATQSHVSVLTSASVPTKPSTPRVLFNTMIACLLGTIMAVGIALALELLDRRVRTFDDVPAALGLPVIGVMSAPAGKLSMSGRRQALLQQRLVAQLPAPAKGA